MLMQFGALLSGIVNQVLPVGLDIGRQFLQRELGRDQRRAQKNLIKRQAAAAGLSGPGFTAAQSPGTVGPTFAPTVAAAPIPVRTAGFQPAGGRGAIGDLLDGFVGGRPGMFVGRGATGSFNGTTQMSGPMPFAASRSERFVLDRGSGCLREAMPGEKGAKFRIDANGDFVRVKPRRINPLNAKAAKRAGRRIDATLRAVKDLVSIQTKKDKGVSARGGKVVKFRTRRKKAC